jgi:hypothetical protein
MWGIQLLRGLVFSATVMALVGCGTIKFGDRKLNSRYVYAESVVTPSRNVSVSAQHTSFGLRCGFTTEQYEAAYDEALAQVEGANVLLDYTTDYDILYFPLVCFNKLKLSGLAAQAQVR